MKPLFFVACVSLLATVAATQPSPDDASRIYAETAGSVFPLLVKSALGQDVAQGTGFLIAGGRIVTNEHVVRRGEKILLVLGEAKISLRLEKSDAARDLAVLKSDVELTARPLELSQAMPKPGESVIVIGTPAGLERSISSGLSSGLREIDSQRVLQITAPISPGSSGGPVFDRAGRVVGVATSTLADGQNLNFAVPVSELRDFLSLDDTPATARVESSSRAAVAQPKVKGPCKVFFIAVEQDAITVNLRMVGLNKSQNDWYRKNQKDFAGVCLVHANQSNERVPLESLSEDYINSIVGDSSLYLIAWEQHRVFVPDSDGGHYAYSANGTLSRWENGKKFIPAGPVHNTNRTILSNSSVSLLKDAIKDIQRNEGL